MQRNTILPFCLLLFPGAILCQVIPSSQAPASHSAYSIPITYTSSTPVNFVRTWTARAPLTSPASTDFEDNSKYQQTTAYFDGLGRPLQEVVKACNPDGTKDIVSVHVYDEFGREAQQYLPYPATPAAGNEGKFKLDPFTAQQSYYHTTYNDQRPFSETFFEASPLNRPITAFAPGNSWMGSKSTAIPPDPTNEHATRSGYEINSADEVVAWNIGHNSGDIPVKAASTYYVAGELYRNIATDEHHNRVIEYKDKQGQLILKKVELPTTTGTPSDKRLHTGWLCTYYVYDDFGLLRFVMQPKAVAWLADPAHNWTFPAGAGGGNIGNELCFRYEYDSRNRMVVKKVPGAGEVHMVYDKRDRLAMTQDAAQRSQGKWLVTQYDELNRPMRTYLWDNTGSRITHESSASATGAPVDYPTLFGTSELLAETYYDNYDWVSASGCGLDATLEQLQVSAGNFLTPSNTTQPYPQPVQADYNLKGMVTGTKVKVLGTNSYLYAVSFLDDRGRVVQVQSTNYGGGKDVVTTQYSYDGRPLQSNHYHKPSSSGTGLLVTSKMTYTPAGQLLKTTKKVAQIEISGGSVSATGIRTPEVVIAENGYDDLGKLKTKKLGQQKDPYSIQNPVYTATPLETLDYTYTIRGWLAGINRGYANPVRHSSEAATQNDRWFGMELNYDGGFSKTHYNGNISGTIWHSRGDDEKRAYGFDYDAANRLLNADFTQNTGSGSWDVSAGIDFSMKMGNGATAAYDANGNIIAMQQKGYKTGGSTIIDDLQYAYFTNTNKLSAVTEQGGGTTQHHVGDFTDGNSSGDDYGYDVNGNLIADKNKNISGTTGVDVTTGGAILYNHLNLPKQITVAAKGTITYVYDAAGNKLEKKTTDNTLSPARETITYYTAGFVYEKINGGPVKLLHFGHEEGRIRLVMKTTIDVTENVWCPPVAQTDCYGCPPPENTCYPFLSFTNYDAYEFDYFIKDHLGNIRAVLTDELQQDNYPAATLEGTNTDNNTALPVEKTFYTIDEENIVDKPPVIPDYVNNNGFINPNPQGNSFAASQKVYRLNGANDNAQKGLDVVLKVMSGDRIDIHGKSYHNSSGSNSSTPIPILALLAGLLTSSGGIAGSATHATATALSSLPNTVNPLNALQLLQQSSAGSNPVASINWILFDEHFNVIDKSFSPVAGTGSVKDHYTDAQLQNIPVGRNGYLYVYCSNESPVDVFFDNLQVVHARGPLLEETHYYPFGLTMAGISSKAAGKAENKKKYNAGSELQNKEFSDGSGLDFYDTHYRQLDPQLGRWNQIDPKADSSYTMSPYLAMSNNPILRNDPLGDQDSTKTNAPKPAYYPAPKTLPGFPDAKRTYNPESGRYRWKLPDGGILEWDKQHGEVEKYDKTGRNHQGAYDPETGEQLKPGIDSRTTPKTVGDLNPIGAKQVVTTTAKVLTAAVIIYAGIKVIELAAAIASGGTLSWLLAF